MANWTIRRAKAADATLLATCIDAAYATYEDKGIVLPAVSDGIADDINDNLVWVAIVDRQVVGGLVLVAREDHAIIANIAVAPAVTGLGLGRALMEQAEREARQLALEKLRLTTHVDLPENVRLYEHLGWRETDRTGDKVHMEKMIATR